MIVSVSLRYLVLALLPAIGFSADLYTIQTFAGSSSTGDGGPATAALIGEASGLAADGQGNVYIADPLDHRVRRISTSGIIRSVAGTGVAGFSGDNAAAVSAQLNAPYGVAVNGNGDLYIADLGNSRVRMVSAATGVITTIAGGGTFTGEGSPAVATALGSPRNVALSADGTLYISDFSANRVVSVAADGILRYAVGTGIAGLYGDSGSPTLAQLRNPAGLAFDPNGVLYIADSGNRCIRKVTSSRITTLATPDLYTPTDVAADSSGNLFIADGRSDETLRLSITGQTTTVHAGSRALALGPALDLYLGYGTQVRRYSGGTTALFAGTGQFTFGGDGGPATAARMLQPAGVVTDPAGNTYIADTGNHRVRRVTPDGRISTYAGTGVRGFSGDGLFAPLAELDSPSSLAVDSSLNLYILDAGNRRIRRVSPLGVIWTIAGTGLNGFSGDGGPALFAEFDTPTALSLDPQNNLYIADTGNQRIRRIDASSSAISTVAGSGTRGNAGDGQAATRAQLNAPRAAVADGSGNLYIADTGNHRIRHVTPDGLIGDFNSSEWSSPSGLTLATDGSLLVADSGIQRIRRLDARGTAGTLAGSGQTGFAGDGGPALQSSLNLPAAMAITPAGDILFADTGNNRVRVLSAGSSSSAVSDAALSVTLANAASMVEGPVAPGEIVVVTSAAITDKSNFTFDDIAAPLLTWSSGQATIQVPYEVSGKKASQLQIYSGSELKLDALVSVADSAPGLYADNGKGQAVGYNEDGTPNSLLAPAPRSSVVTVLATGEGQTDPSGVTGQPAGDTPAKPLLDVQALVAGTPAEVVSAVEAPGLLGNLMLKIRVPVGFLPSGVVPLTITIGGRATQAGVTVVIE